MVSQKRLWTPSKKLNFKKVISMSTFSLQDKYVLLHAENIKLRRQLGKAHEALRYWKELSLHYQAERDYYQEQIQEGNRDL